MAEVKVIQMRNVPDKWQKLLMCLQNSPQTAFRILLPTQEKAAYVRDRLRRVCYERPEWFKLFVTVKGCDVYVINFARAQKVKIVYN